MLVLARADKSKVLILSLIVTAVQKKKEHLYLRFYSAEIDFETLKYFKLIDKLFYQLFMMRSFEFT